MFGIFNQMSFSFNKYVLIILGTTTLTSLGYIYYNSSKSNKSEQINITVNIKRGSSPPFERGEINPPFDSPLREDSPPL